MQKVSTPPLLPGLVLALLVGGCTIRHSGSAEVAGKDASPGVAPVDPRTRIEEVFRLQNRVMAKLMENNALGEADPAILQLESKIVERCRYLNESASLHMEGKPLSLELRKNVLLTVDACESAALAAEASIGKASGEAL